MKAQDREIIEIAPEMSSKPSLETPRAASRKEELHIVKELHYNLLQLEDLQSRFRFVMGEIRSALKVK